MAIGVTKTRSVRPRCGQQSYGIPYGLWRVKYIRRLSTFDVVVSIYVRIANVSRPTLLRDFGDYSCSLKFHLALLGLMGGGVDENAPPTRRCSTPVFSRITRVHRVPVAE